MIGRPCEREALKDAVRAGSETTTADGRALPAARAGREREDRLRLSASVNERRWAARSFTGGLATFPANEAA